VGIRSGRERVSGYLQKTQRQWKRYSMPVRKQLLEVNHQRQFAEYVCFDSHTGEMLGIETVTFHDLLLNKTKHDRELYERGELGADTFRPKANVPVDIQAQAIREGWDDKDWDKKFINNPDYSKLRIDK